MNNLKSVVLKTKKRNEHDYLLVCLTKELGKVYMIAPRGVKTNSPLRSFCQVLTHGIVSVKKSRNNSEIYYINQAEVLNNYKSIKEHELKLASASYILNLIADLVDTLQPDRDSYYLLTGYLDALNLLEGNNNINFLHTVILLRIIEHHGIGGIPNYCGSCGAEITGKYFLCKDKGLFLCKNCKTNNSVLMSESFHMLWYRLLNMNIAEEDFFELPESFIKGLEFYVKTLIGKETGGAKYLKMIRGY